MLLQADIRLVQSPADPLEIGADIEEVSSFGVEAGKDTFLADGYAEV
jgi:hypothetical protein